MGLDSAAVLGHEIEAEGLWELPQLLSPEHAPRLADTIAEFDRQANEYMVVKHQLPPGFYRAAEQTWTVCPTRLPLFKDTTGALTLEEPPATYEDIGAGSRQIHFSPVAAWRTVGVEEWWAMKKPVEVDGPPGLNLTIGPHTLQLYCWLRWGIFLSEPTLQLALRRVCHEFALVVGSPMAIYVSDARTPIDAIVDGLTIEEIVAQLCAGLDTLRPILSVIDKDSALDNSDHDAYYLDAFADL